MCETVHSSSSEATTLTKKNRNNNIDLIRVISCIAVVGLHSLPKDCQIYTAVLYYLCGFAVPFFFMSSGYFLLNRGKIKVRYSLRKIVGVLKIVICWNLIYVLLKLLKQIVTGKAITIGILTLPIECVRSLIQKGNMWQFWFLGALIIIYALVPLISLLSKKGKRVLLFASGIIAVMLEVISVLSGNSIQTNVIQTFRIWTWLFYFVIGGEMKQITDIISSKISIKLNVYLFVVVTLINMIYQNYVGTFLIHPDSGIRLHAEYFYDSLFEIIWIMLFFSMLLRVNITESLRKITEKMAPLTMGIYIVHPILKPVLNKFISNVSVYGAVIYWSLLLLISTIIIWIVSKTPMKKYLLKV